MAAIEKYLDFLWNCFQSDIHIFSLSWLYYYLLIPAAGYFVFFILKWIVLTIPMWMPVAIIIRVANLPSPKCRICQYKIMYDSEGSAAEERMKEIHSREKEPEIKGM
jgi:hypothetical protein